MLVGKYGFYYFTSLSIFIVVQQIEIKGLVHNTEISYHKFLYFKNKNNYNTYERFKKN